MRRQWVLQSRHLESRAKGVARLVIEVSAGCASPSFRGLWGGEALLLSPPALLETEILGFAGPRRIAEPADEQVEGGLAGGGRTGLSGSFMARLTSSNSPAPRRGSSACSSHREPATNATASTTGSSSGGMALVFTLTFVPVPVPSATCSVWWVECVGSEELCVVLASW